MKSFPSLRSDTTLARQWVCLQCRTRQTQRTAISFSKNAFFSNAKAGRRPLSICAQSRKSDITLRPKTQRRFSTTSSRETPRKAVLPDAPARTRFAPSPTGYLHIGGLRTALFSYLLAKRTGGQFILRIEDTDQQKRLVHDAEARLYEDLRWAGTEWDEGPSTGGPYGPYRQSERNAIYQDHAARLLADGSAYRCFCTQQSSAATSGSYVTSGCHQNCSSLSIAQSQEKAHHGQAFTVRLHPPADAHKRTYPDLVYGKIQRLKRSPAAPQVASEDGASDGASDSILMKSDGTPTYHFANVIDDHLMNITHVIRGSEWMASTPLHYDIYSAFQWEPPQFAHVGLLVDKNQAKLSKRNQDLDLDVRSMREAHGVLPYSLNNFLALLGWSNPNQSDRMSMESLIKNFDLKFTRGNAMVRTEKLWYLQKQHVAVRCELAVETKSLRPIEPVVHQVAAEVRRVFPQPHASPDALAAYCTEVLLADRNSYTNAPHFVERNKYFFHFDPSLQPAREEYSKDSSRFKAITPDMLDDVLRNALADLRTRQQTAGDDTAVRTMESLHATVDESEELLRRYKTFSAALMRYLRYRLCYKLPGPKIGLVMALLGPEECARRLQL
ncbi:hypothetical protein BDY17DRAFT_246325 [Neohortaea acidophila]|uniref:glutamate--tRNA ligase n=1 Tax=Neohortaea acidophila TaxID=245834 RepID=A0A6A6Q1T9_9PEZI|nr:uncharacterized protein BDY17DRAFT_246325 [Neohortaea acidophila]KAF2486252.1 hypothetical protein BDY17DRAFT_246325 [Neohortaea acidophila]